MGKIYIRKTNRQNWSHEAAKEAIREVQNGISTNAAAKQYGIPEATLRRYIKNNPYVSIITLPGF